MAKRLPSLALMGIVALSLTAAATGDSATGPAVADPAVRAQIAKTLDQLRASASALAGADAVQARALRSTLERITEWTADNPTVRRQDLQDLEKVRDRLEGLAKMWRGAKQTAKADLLDDQSRKVGQACAVFQTMVTDEPAAGPVALAEGAPAGEGRGTLTVALRMGFAPPGRDPAAPGVRQDKVLTIELVEPNEQFPSALLLRRYVSEHAGEIASAAIAFQVDPDVLWRDVSAVVGVFSEAPLSGAMAFEGLPLRGPVRTVIGQATAPTETSSAPPGPESVTPEMPAPEVPEAPAAPPTPVSPSPEAAPLKLGVTPLGPMDPAP